MQIKKDLDYNFDNSSRTCSINHIGVEVAPQIPTELRQPDFGRQEESFVRKTNGGQSYQEVRPNPTDRRLTQKDRPVEKRTRSARVQDFSFFYS